VVAGVAQGGHGAGGQVRLVIRVGPDAEYGAQVLDRQPHLSSFVDGFTRPGWPRS
jgi:hypothetical protein